MRSESTATWTSGEPVSPSPVAYCVITSFFRSAVTDIGSSRSVAKPLGARAEIENPERPELPLGDFRERYRLASGRREIDRPTLEIRSRVGTVLLFHQARKMRRADEDGVAAAKANRIRLRHGQRRDAVQRGRDGP